MLRHIMLPFPGKFGFALIREDRIHILALTCRGSFRLCSNKWVVDYGFLWFLSENELVGSGFLLGPHCVLDKNLKYIVEFCLILNRKLLIKN